MMCGLSIQLCTNARVVGWNIWTIWTTVLDLMNLTAAGRWLKYIKVHSTTKGWGWMLGWGSSLASPGQGLCFRILSRDHDLGRGAFFGEINHDHPWHPWITQEWQWWSCWEGVLTLAQPQELHLLCFTGETTRKGGADPAVETTTRCKKTLGARKMTTAHWRPSGCEHAVTLKALVFHVQHVYHDRSVGIK